MEAMDVAAVGGWLRGVNLEAAAVVAEREGVNGDVLLALAAEETGLETGLAWPSLFTAPRSAGHSRGSREPTAPSGALTKMATTATGMPSGSTTHCRLHRWLAHAGTKCRPRMSRRSLTTPLGWSLSRRRPTI